MKKMFLCVLAVVMMAGLCWSQEVVISGYPKGVAGSITSDFFKPYYPQLQEIAAVLGQHPEKMGVVIGGADGYTYRQNHDAKNPGLSLGRAHVLRQLLIEVFGVDSAQLVIKTIDVKDKGDQYRFSSVRIEEGAAAPMATVDTVYLAPTIKNNDIHHNYYFDEFGLQLGLGLTATPSGIVPFVSGEVVYKKWLSVGASFGHTFWSGDRNVFEQQYDVWKRFSGGQLTVYPFSKKKIGLTAGWMRLEEISRHYYKYARMSEGLTLGLRYRLNGSWVLSGGYFPNKQRSAERNFAVSKKNQFLLSVSYNLSFGGEK